MKQSDSRESQQRLTVDTFGVQKRGSGFVLQADQKSYPVQPISEYLTGERRSFFQDACRALKNNGSPSQTKKERLQEILNEAINQGVVEPC